MEADDLPAHMNPANPYATPASSAAADPVSFSAFGELVKGWEKLRLLYNGMLLLPGIGVLAVAFSRDSMPLPLAITSGLLCGLGANAAFFGGPLAELYLRAALFRGEPKPWLRKGLFCGGCFLSFVAMGLFLLGVLLEPMMLSGQPM